jgi:predicted nicotinamide N-methyase
MEYKTIGFSFDSIHLKIPEPESIKDAYTKAFALDQNIPFPYWSKLWPASKALAQFIKQNPNHFYNKKVAELGAGLALPSFVAAPFASSIEASDYVPDAIELMKANILHNGLQNISARVLNWNDFTESEYPEIVLLSDVNYEPASFDALYILISKLLKSGVILFLATPQRLQGANFINLLQNSIVATTNYSIEINNTTTPISIFHLQKQ